VGFNVEFDYSRQYLKWHDASEEHARIVGDAEYRALKAFIGQNRNMKVLDFGCGMGFALTGLKCAGYADLTGIDADKSQVGYARARGLSVDLVPVEETMARLGREKGVYDFVFCLDVLEHIPEDQVVTVAAALRECLKPGGTFLCRVPNCNSLVGTRLRYIDWTHVVSFSESSLDFVLFHAGFADIRILEQPDFISKRPLAFVLWLARRILRTMRRLAFATEIGAKEAMGLPMSPNILGVARNL
jgi:2-polyprenyl-3-methyl-5-hydroxy-6-metoxy-1,4-benzoquinol methylase